MYGSQSSMAPSGVPPENSACIERLAVRESDISAGPDGIGIGAVAEVDGPVLEVAVESRAGNR